MKKILVTGASGLLGLNFCYFFQKKYRVTGVCNKSVLYNPPFVPLALDLSKYARKQSRAELEQFLEEISPDVILNCAALANIDQCEQHPDEAMIINVEVPGILAEAAKKLNIQFVHISTDAVFDGEDCGLDGYHEDDKTNPLSRYAETKLAGEQNVLDSNPEALVARVNFYGWSISGYRSLVEFFYNNLLAGNKVNGFSDVYFCTLYVRHLAELLDEMISLRANGIYHVFSGSHQSKYDFGVSIAKKFGFDENLVHPVSWKDGGLTAKRSPNLIMNTDKLQNLLGHGLPSQKDSLDLLYSDTIDGLRQTIQGYGIPKKTEESIWK